MASGKTGAITNRVNSCKWFTNSYSHFTMYASFFSLALLFGIFGIRSSASFCLAALDCRIFCTFSLKNGGTTGSRVVNGRAWYTAYCKKKNKRCGDNRWVVLIYIFELSTTIIGRLFYKSGKSWAGDTSLFVGKWNIPFICFKCSQFMHITWDQGSCMK